MIETLISSKTRIKLLLKFFLNSKNKSYLRNLEAEFGESTNAIRIELNRFEDANLLKSEIEGNRKYFRANTRHPLFPDIHSIVMKYLGIDHLLEKVIQELGNVRKVYLTGNLARGQDSEIIDLVLVGEINKNYLIQLIEKAETIIPRKIRYLIFSGSEFSEKEFELKNPMSLKVWDMEK